MKKKSQTNCKQKNNTKTTNHPLPSAKTNIANWKITMFKRPWPPSIPLSHGKSPCKYYFDRAKSPLLTDKSTINGLFFMGKSQFFIEKSQFFIGKSQLFIGKSPFFIGKITILHRKITIFHPRFGYHRGTTNRQPW